MYEKRNYTTFSNNEIDEEFAQSSNEKRRKTMGDGGDVEGCKLCNCKKTKCLKLYCNCFADGIYCDGNCSCQGCLNKPDYEDTVAETIHKIQSRNPLAFAPKTIQNATEPLNSNIIVEIENGFTPASTRHKRGCNCKKSMCLKKYCECYQAKVGCSNGCNCEGCKNRFGLKEDYGKAKHLVGERDNTNISFPEKLEMSNSGNNVWQTDVFNPHNSTPMTPSFEYSNHDNHGSESWFSSGEFFQSPESATYLDYGSSPGLLMNYDGQNMIQNNDLFDYGNALTINDFSPRYQNMIQNNDLFDYGNALTINDFSPRYHGPHITGHNHPVLSPQDWANRSQPQSGNSLNWCKSPTSTINYVSGNKFIDTLDYSGLYNTLENDTPEILKETSTLSSVVKVSSSNKKRVSPPHSYMDSGVSSGSSSSPSLRSGHEFILHSVPSFPPLSPYIEFRSDENQSSNGTQDCTERK